MMPSTQCCGRLLAVALVPLGAGAEVRTSADYRVTVETVAPAGGTSTSADYEALATVGGIAGTLDGGGGSLCMASGYPAQGVSFVSGRWIFYNQSVWDGNRAAADAGDDAAIATDKTALLPGSTASFANYTSYSRGINGLLVDVTELGAVPAASDFAFRVGNDAAPAGWTAAPAPSGVTVRWGAGVDGSDRVTVLWADGAIRRTWLQVTTLADGNTGLGAADVFYFGNAVGETGNSPGDARVTAADALRVLGSITATAGISNPFDINRDGKVGASDRLLVLGNVSALQPLAWINLGGSGAAAALAAPVPEGSWHAEVRPVPAGLAVRWVADGEAVRVWTTDVFPGGNWELYGELGGGAVPGDAVEVFLPIAPGEPARLYRLDSRVTRAIGPGDGASGE